jgi:hypothetical protein
MAVSHVLAHRVRLQTSAFSTQLEFIMFRLITVTVE